MSIEQITIILSVLAFIAIGFVTKKNRKESMANFTLSKGKLHWFTIATGISMTFAGGAAILNTVSLSYNFKWYTLVDPLAVLIGSLIVIYYYSKYQQDNGVTVSDLLSSNNKKLSILIGVITSFVFLLIVAAQFVALSKLVSPFFPNVHELVITFILSTLVFSYVYWGGFRSVTKTDILQFILILIFLVVPVLFFIMFGTMEAETSQEVHAFSRMPLNYIILFSIPILFLPLSQDINIRIKSAKSTRDGKIGIIVGALFYFLILFATTLIGIYLGEHNVELNDSEQALSVFLNSHFYSFGSLGIIAALAAIISSIDSYVLNGVTSIANDILKPLLRDDNKTLINKSSVIVYVVAIIIALYFNQILALVLTSLLIYISTLLPIALANRLQIEGDKIFWAILVTIVIIAVMEIMKINIGPTAIVYPMIGMALVSLLFFNQRLKLWGSREN